MEAIKKILAEKDQEEILSRLSSLFFLIGMLMSYKLWVGERSFPSVPILDGLQLNPSLGMLLSLFLALLLLSNTLKSHHFLAIGIMVLTLCLLMLDQLRIQPWVYHYFLFILPFSFSPSSKKNLGYFQLILFAIYFWGGLHKLNSDFTYEVYPLIAKDFLGADFLASQRKLAYLIPVGEIILSILLLIPKSRKIAVYMAYGLHVFIIIWLLGIDSPNTVVIPWNLAMIAFVYLCFHQAENKYPWQSIWKGKNYLTSLVVSLVLMLPTLTFWGKWDQYLSFCLYSGKNKLFYIAVEETELSKLPMDLEDIFLEIEGLQGGKVIDVNAWSLAELNVPFPPEKRIMQSVSTSFCQLDFSKQGLMFLEFERPLSEEKYVAYPCED